MQNLVAKHGKQIIAGGPLKGTSFESVTDEKVKRAAKRYTGDPAFQKYARGYVLLQDLDMAMADQPQPCAPIGFEGMNSGGKASENYIIACCKSWMWKLWGSQWAKAAILCCLLAWLLRPSVSAFAAKAVVTALRLSIRRMVAFASMILEGLLDEMIFQLEYTVRDALPSGMEIPERVVMQSSWLSHLFSGGIGAGVVLLTSLRRGQGQA